MLEDSNAIANNSFARREKPALPVRMQRVLLLCALGLGILFDRLLPALPDEGAFGFGWGLFWLAYTAVILCLTWHTAAKRRQAWVVLGVAALLCVSGLVRDRNTIRFFNVPVIPLLLMLYTQMVTAKETAPQEHVLALRVVQGFIVWPFAHLLSVPTALSGLVAGKKSRSRSVLTGLAIAVPILAVVGMLLLEADAVVGYYLQRFFNALRVDELIGHGALIVIVAVLFGSFLTSAKLDDSRVEPVKFRQNWEPATAAVVLALLVAMYALFCGVQFVYLFGSRGLPAELSYSEYARKGFGELLAVAAINLSLFGLCLRFTRPHRVVRAMLLALLVCTGVLLISALRRLGLYIEAYGLTWLRVFPFTFMVALGVVLALCAVRLFAGKLPLLRLSALVLMLWYTGLALVNVEAVIVRWNEKMLVTTQRAEAGRELLPSLDGEIQPQPPYVYELSSDAVPELIRAYRAQPNPQAETEYFERMLRELERDGCWNLADLEARDALRELLGK